ncbi:MAG TPA: hypothetical protein DIU37_03950, partial [Opitutae bacterium]|nr:hypothetical protein [Opitutae bacterium]
AKQYGVSVKSIASASGIQANESLKVGQVLQIPGSSGQASMQSSSTQQASEAHYTVQRGDTLSSISHRYHVSVRSLKQANGLTSDRIRVGQTLSIPGSVASASTSQASQVSTQSNANSTTHEIQRGETLSVIATRYGVSVSDLMAWNNIEDPRRLQVGQELVLHASTKVPASTSEVAVTSSTKNVGEGEVVSVPVVEAVEIETVEEDALPEDFGDDSIFDTSDSVPVVPIESTQS